MMMSQAWNIDYVFESHGGNLMSSGAEAEFGRFAWSSVGYAISYHVDNKAEKLF